MERCEIKMRQVGFKFRTWGGKRKGAGRKPDGRARRRWAWRAGGVEGAVSRACHLAHAGGRLELADAALLYGAGARVLGRRGSLRVQARALLGAGESFAPARRGAGRAVAVARDERARRARGARAQSRDEAARARARRSLSRAHLADADARRGARAPIWCRTRSGTTGAATADPYTSTTPVIEPDTFLMRRLC